MVDDPDYPSSKTYKDGCKYPCVGKYQTGKGELSYDEEVGYD